MVKKRKLYCFSHYEFNDLMKKNNWKKSHPNDFVTISISSPLDDDYGHWFDDSVSNNLNLDFADITHGKYAMTQEQAHKLFDFIEEAVNDGKDIYVHCSAGASRSQGVVRFIFDYYDNIDWETRKDNPCLTPNVHVSSLLKRIAWSRKF